MKNLQPHYLTSGKLAHSDQLEADSSKQNSLNFCWHCSGWFKPVPYPTVENALKLAYVKLIQVGGFNHVNGMSDNIHDIQAQKQILDAIHTFDPSWDFTSDQEE